MRKSKPGEAFEKLTTCIERVIGFHDDRKVEYSKRLRHLITGRLRQFDVIITFPLDHHTFVTAIECKDFSRPVDVKEIEAFVTKINGCPVNRGCMVARSFTDDARAVAYNNKISCFDLREIESDDWLSPIWRSRTLCIEKLFVTGDVSESLSEEEACRVFDEFGQPVPDRVLYNYARTLMRLGWPGDQKTRVATLVVGGKRYGLLHPDERISILEKMVLTVFYHWEEKEELFTIHSYQVGDELVQIATADVRIDHSPTEYENLKLLVKKGDDSFYTVAEPKPGDDARNHVRVLKKVEKD